MLSKKVIQLSRFVVGAPGFLFLAVPAVDGAKEADVCDVDLLDVEVNCG